MKDQISANNLLRMDSFDVEPVGTTAIQPAIFPGMGSNTYKRNGISYTTIATKAAVINKFEESFVSFDGSLIPALDGLPYLAVALDQEDCSFKTMKTTFELPHRIGSGVFAIKHSKSPDWNFNELLLEKMKEVGPYNAVAYYDPISALLGSFLSHYKNIPSQWSKFTGAVVGGCVAVNTQPVIATGVTKDPLGANKDDHFAIDNNDKGKASAQGLGNIIHLDNDFDAESIVLNLYLNQPRLRFFAQEMQELLTSIYTYGALKMLDSGIDFRNRCFVRSTTPVKFDEKKLTSDIQNKIEVCKKAGLLNDSPLIRTLPISFIK